MTSAQLEYTLIDLIQVKLPIGANNYNNYNYTHYKPYKYQPLEYHNDMTQIQPFITFFGLK